MDAIMTLDQSIGLITVLFGLVMVLVGYLGKMVFGRLDGSEKRMTEIETNYNSKFDKVHLSIAEVLAKVGETKHDVLNALNKVMLLREQDKDANRDDYVTKEFCEMIHRQRTHNG